MLWIDEVNDENFEYAKKCLSSDSEAASSNPFIKSLLVSILHFHTYKYGKYEVFLKHSVLFWQSWKTWLESSSMDPAFLNPAWSKKGS